MTIAEVCKKYNLSADTLRYYERIGLLPSITRTAGGIRNFSEKDCGWVEFIKCMRGAGLPIEVLIEYVGLVLQGDETIPARKALLVEQREQLFARISELQSTLARLDYKIENYEKTVVPAQDKVIKE